MKRGILFVSAMLVGFAAETDEMRSNAQAKLESKNLDLIVANDVSAPAVGFAHDTNAVTLLRSGAKAISSLLSLRAT